MASVRALALGLASAREACQVHTCKKPLPFCCKEGPTAEHREVLDTRQTEGPELFPTPAVRSGSPFR